MQHRTTTFVTPPTLPARAWRPIATDLPRDRDLPGSEEEVVAPRLVARLERVRVVAAPPEEEPTGRSVVGMVIVAGAVGLGSLAAALLVGLAAVVGWAARVAAG